MSSSPARGLAAWPLRRRLIVEQIILLAIVCVVIVAVTLLALQAFLVNQLDDRLTEASDRAGHFLGPPPGDQRGRVVVKLPPLDAPGQAVGTFNALIVDGSVADAARRVSDGAAEFLPSEDYRTLLALPADRTAYTRALGDFGEYRLIAAERPGGEVIVTGLPMSEVDDTLLSGGLILGGVMLAGLLAAAGGGALIVRRTLQPLQGVVRTASRVAELPLDRGEVDIVERVPDRYTDPRTEVGQVGLALNRMLGHVHGALVARHESETRVRQFVADASHELRTPLAAVRGYAELLRRGEADVADEAHAVSRIESAATRMTALVEDLLLLARLDAGRPLEHSTVDLSRLVVDAVSDAQVAGIDHVWRLDLPPDPVTATGDAARLYQVVANLLSNARTHTPEGTTVVTGLSTSDNAVVITVRDDGPGIPVELREEIFERFARGDSSRSRAAGSTGLGLAIVAAVVAAHDGQVIAVSRPGHTQFTVTLPASRTAGAQDRPS